MVVDKTSAMVAQDDAPVRATKLPRAVQFPLLVTLSMALSSLLYSFAAEYIAGDLARVSRNLGEWWEVAALVGWRTFELGLGWYGLYDSYDLASLSLLSHGPFLLLLYSFYNVSSSTALLSLIINALATYLPFRLLRPLSAAHASSSKNSKSVPNRDIVTDYSVQALTTVLAASIYSVVLYAAYTTYLPVSLVIHFDDIPSVAVTHESNYITLLPLTLIAGLAARSFIFTPVTAMPVKSVRRFDPVTASFGETLAHNVVGDNARVKAVFKRTSTLIIISGVNTFVQVFGTVQGVDAQGAAAYSAVWVTAAAITGIALGLVGAV